MGLTVPELKPVLLFVHGFNSNAQKCWGQLRALLNVDPDLKDAFEYRDFEYETGLGIRRTILFWTRLPSLQSLAAMLRSRLERPDYLGREITLVGHSQGGLVILRHLVDLIDTKEINTLVRIRQVVLFATPIEGSGFLNILRRFLYSIFSNPQEAFLRVANEELSELRANIRQKIVRVEKASDDGFPIPVRTFSGTSDGIVLTASARGPFDENHRELQGTHTMLKQPKDRHDDRFVLFKSTLLDPVAHPKIHEIERLRTRIAVVPKASPQSVDFLGKTVKVHSDTESRVDRQVRFARQNLCCERYEIRYGTKQGGLITASTSPNNARAQDQDILQRSNGGEFIWATKPTRKDETDYFVHLTVYKGFDSNDRNTHFHFGRCERFYREIYFEVDLSAYLRAGYEVTPPELRHYENTAACTAECRAAREAKIVAPIGSDDFRAEDGVWSWTVKNLRRGVLDVCFDVAKTDGK